MQKCKSAALCLAHFGPDPISQEHPMYLSDKLGEGGKTDSYSALQKSHDPLWQGTHLSRWAGEVIHPATGSQEPGALMRFRQFHQNNHPNYFASSNPRPPHCVNSSMVFEWLGAYDCSTSYPPVCVSNSFVCEPISRTQTLVPLTKAKPLPKRNPTGD